ncbi:hypothetical protein C8R44DRAFT_879988 [Mycena epipterygia]|nr:hypothetical protein C8R44DRAFT_879988 [Mycena epipterygia]
MIARMDHAPPQNLAPTCLGTALAAKFVVPTSGTANEIRQRATHLKRNANNAHSSNIISYVNHVTPIPDGCDSNAAASILCAGVTVYQAIKHSQTSESGRLDRSPRCRRRPSRFGADKKKLCLKLGADKCIDFKDSKNLVEEIKATTVSLGAGGALKAVGHPERHFSIFFMMFKYPRLVLRNQEDAVAAREQIHSDLSSSDLQFDCEVLTSRGLGTIDSLDVNERDRLAIAGTKMGKVEDGKNSCQHRSSQCTAGRIEVVRTVDPGEKPRPEETFNKALR